MTVLAVDIGGSGSLALLRDVTLHAAVGAPIRITDGRLSATEALSSLAKQLPAMEGRLDVIAVGLASITSFGDPEDLAEQVRRHFCCHRLVLASDAVMGLVSVWGTDGGAVVAAGTGVVGLATDFSGQWTRVDGGGHLIGDAASGRQVPASYPPYLYFYFDSLDLPRPPQMNQGES